MSTPTPTGDSAHDQFPPASSPAMPAQAPQYYQQTPTPPTPTDAEKYEQRIRDLMSAKDKALRDANLQQQHAIELQQQLEAQQQQHSQLIEGATRATESLLQAKAQLEQQQQRLAAENLKLTMLAKQPDLLPYAEFIPASTQEADVQAAIERFRAAQLQAAPRTAPAAAPPSMQGLYPSNQSVQVPSAQPAASPVPEFSATIDDFAARVKQLDNLSPNDRVLKFNELVTEAEALARRQFNQ